MKYLRSGMSKLMNCLRQVQLKTMGYAPSQWPNRLRRSRVLPWLTAWIGLFAGINTPAVLAQTWLPAPPAISCNNHPYLSDADFYTAGKTVPSPVLAGQDYSFAATGNLGGGVTDQYYTQLVGNELQIHLRSSDVPTLFPPNCYIYPNLPKINNPGRVAIKLYYYPRSGDPKLPYQTNGRVVSTSFDVFDAAFLQKVPNLNTLAILVLVFSLMYLGIRVLKIHSLRLLILLSVIAPHYNFFITSAHAQNNASTSNSNAQKDLIER